MDDESLEMTDAWSGQREEIPFRHTLSPALDHAHLWAVCVTRPTDFEPCGYRSREMGAPDCSCGCRWFVPLAKPFWGDWGICANALSPRAGLLTFEHQGCPQFEETPEEARWPEDAVSEDAG